MTLVGRDRERQFVEDLIGAVHTKGAACLIRGEPGIGKSALLAAAEAIAEGRGMAILRCAGIESEANLPFAGLHQAIHPILDRLTRLPGPQRSSLETAFGMRDDEPANDFIIALATLNLLADLARESPVLWVIDDAEWLDEPTAKVAAFVARRLESDRILLLASMRMDSPSSPLLRANLRELPLPPLVDESARVLLDSTNADLTPSERRQILREAAGNPLALVELPRAVRRGGSGDAVIGLGTVALTDRVRDAFAGQVASVPSETRALLLVAALNDSESLAESMAAASLVTGATRDVEIIEPALEAALVNVDRERLRFRHPLVRSAIHEAATLTERRNAHAALGAVIADDHDRRTWHLAASIIGHDEGVASDLETVSRNARRRAAVEVASAAMTRAAELTPDREHRARRLLQAARFDFELGRPQSVSNLLAEARDLDAERNLHWQMTALQEAREEDVAWDTNRVRELLEEVGHAQAAGDRDVALELLRAAALRCWWSGSDDAVRRDVSRAAEDLIDDAGSPVLLLIRALADPFRNAGSILSKIPRRVPARAPSDVPRMLGTTAAILGAWDVALPLLRTAADRLRAEGRLALVVQMDVTIAFGALMTGDWNGAMGAASEALRLGEETQQPRWLHASQIAMAAIEGLRGNASRAKDLLDEAEPWAMQAGSAYVLALASWARGLAALGSGAPTDALVAMHRVLDASDPAYHLSVGSWATGDLAEAALESGGPEALLDVTVRFTALAAQGSAPTLAAGLAFAGALAAADADAEERFERALEASSRLPFLRARVRLAHGIWLRRHRRIREAREPLIAAQDTFDQLGARRWATRAHEELRATGRARPRPSLPGPSEELTPQEFTIAELAAAGLSNREIGARLFLSPRTVGSHLYRLYPKLGVTSRAQLRDALIARGGLVTERA